MRSKKCSQCKRNKKINKFNKTDSNADGYFGYCKACANTNRNRWRRLNPLKAKNIKLKERYGISLEKYQKMKSEQKERCKICRKKKFLCVDHDHKSGKVRGLLCQSCNKGLGHFADNPKLLASAQNYLETT